MTSGTLSKGGLFWPRMYFSLVFVSFMCIKPWLLLQEKQSISSWFCTGGGQHHNRLIHNAGECQRARHFLCDRSRLLQHTVTVSCKHSEAVQHKGKASLFYPRAYLEACKRTASFSFPSILLWAFTFHKTTHHFSTKGVTFLLYWVYAGCKPHSDETDLVLGRPLCTVHLSYPTAIAQSVALSRQTCCLQLGKIPQISPLQRSRA